MSTYGTSHLPIKGILKKSSASTSVGVSGQQSGGATQVIKRKKSQRWDESNIRATHCLSYRDYDLVKANEPGTPCVGGQDTAREFEANKIMTPDMLAKNFAATFTFGTKGAIEDMETGEAPTNWFLLSKQERQRQFELKRKLYYSEALNTKLAHKLLSQHLQDEADEDENQGPKENTTAEVPAGENDPNTQSCNF